MPNIPTFHYSIIPYNTSRDQGISPAGTSIPFSFKYLIVPGCSGMGEYLTAFSAVV
jgi:hypothetical protein